MKKIKEVLELVILAIFTPIIIISMMIHGAYRVWYVRKTIKECSYSLEEREEKTNNSNSNGNHADTESI